MTPRRKNGRGRPKTTASERRQNVAIGTRLRDARLAAGLTQEDVARGLRLTADMIRNYEHGRCAIKLTRIVQLAKLLGCSVAAIMGEA